MASAEALAIAPKGRNGVSTLGFATEFVVIDHGHGLVDDVVTQRAQPEAIVRFLIISRLEHRIETAELVPYRPLSEQKRARAVIHAAPEHHLTRILGKTAAVTKRAAIGPDDAARLLHQAGRKHKFP